MKEYEYSYKVKSIKPYIEYCEENGYILKDETKQVRTLYRNSNGTMARITKKTANEITSLIFDIKDDNLTDEKLKISGETLPLFYNKNQQDVIDSIIDILGYRKDVDLIRTRLVYKKDNHKFEIDDYESPEKMFVVAIEGLKEEVDDVYKLLSNINKKLVLKDK